MLILKYNKSDTAGKQPKIVLSVQQFIYKLKGDILSRLPLVLTEVYKQFSVQHGLFILVIAVFIFFQARISVGAAHNEVQAELERYYNEVRYAENQEEFTEDYLKKIDEWLINAENELLAYQEDNNIYQIQILSEEINIQRQAEDEIVKQRQYRQQLLENKIVCGVVPQQEFQSVTGERMYSYRRYLVKKIYSLILITFIFWIIIYGLNFINLLNVYNINIHDLQYPIQSIMTMQSYPLKISIGMFFVIKNLLRFILMLLTALTGFCISVKTSYKNGVFLCSLIFVPYILDLIGIHIMKYMSVFYWMMIC